MMSSRGSRRTPVALAILPLGTANALAHDLRLPLHPAAAARAALSAQPRQIALGHLRYVSLQGNQQVATSLSPPALESMRTFSTSCNPE